MYFFEGVQCNNENGFEAKEGTTSQSKWTEQRNYKSKEGQEQTEEILLKKQDGQSFQLQRPRHWVKIFCLCVPYS